MADGKKTPDSDKRTPAFHLAIDFPAITVANQKAGRAEVRADGNCWLRANVHLATLTHSDRKMDPFPTSTLFHLITRKLHQAAVIAAPFGHISPLGYGHVYKN